MMMLRSAVVSLCRHSHSTKMSRQSLHRTTFRLVPLTATTRRNQTLPPDRRSTALTVISNLREIRRSPLPALSLGLGGLVPFISAPAYMILTKDFHADLASAQLTYGAAILSFLGGVRWGLTLPPGSNVLPNWTNLIYSVTPCLVAWLGLLIPHYPASTVTVVTGLCGAAYFDLTMAGYPSWFKALRFLLTFVAVLGLWTTLTCKYLLTSKNSASLNEAHVTVNTD